MPRDAAKRRFLTLPDRQSMDKRFSSDTKTLFRGATSAYVLKVVGVGILYVYHLVLGRLLGPSDYGTYVYAISWAGLAAIVSLLGLDRGVLRFGSEFYGSNELSKFKGVLIRSHQIVLCSGSLLASCIFLFLLLGGIGIDAQLKLGLMIIVWKIPVIGLTQLRQQFAKALKRISYAILPEKLVLPVSAVLITVTLHKVGVLNVQTALLALLGASILSLAVGWMLVASILPIELKSAEPAFNSSELIKVSIPMLFASLVGIVLHRIDILMLGVLSTLEDVGVYNAALRTAQMTSFPLVACHTKQEPD